MADFTPEQARAELERRRKLREQEALQVTPEQEQAELERRRASSELAGPPLPEGFDEAQARRQQLSEAYNTGAVPAALAGAVQGATFGFGDEIAGAQNVDLPALLSFDVEKIVGKYREGRDRVRSMNAAQQETSPIAYTAGEVGGGIATAAVPGGGAKTAATVGKAIKTGLASGAVSGLGGSSADLTQGDVAGAAIDTAIGGGLGGGLGGVASAGGKLVGAAVNRVRGAKAAAQTAAREAAESAGQLEQVTQSTTRKSFYETSRELQEESRQLIGEGVTLRPSQLVGDAEMALKELKARNFPGTMSAAQKLEKVQLEQSARYLDALTERIAAKPEMLGRSDVGGQLVAVVDNYVGKLVKARSENAGALYKRASELAGGKRIIPTDETRKAMVEILDENEFGGKLGLYGQSKITGVVRSALESLQEAASEKGRLTLDDMQKMRSAFGKAARGDVNIVEGLSEANQRRLARQVLSAIDKDLETATNGIASKEAAETLLAANKAWREHSQAIDDAATETVKRMLRVDSDAGDTITTKLLRSSPDQVSGVFRLLNKADPDAARQLRAQLFDDVLRSGGKPVRGDSVAKAEGVAEISPLTLRNKLRDAEPLLTAAFEGDQQAQHALKRSFQLIKRVAFGPNIKGSTTAPQLAQEAAEIGQEAASKAASATGPVGSTIVQGLRMIRGILGNDKAMAEMYSSPEHIELFNQALQTQLAGRGKKSISLAAITALSDALGLQVGEQRENREQQQER